MRKKVVVMGGGFAGLQLVRNIDESLFDITLIDKLNHHQFQPLFYQVATAQIEPSSVSFPLRHIFRKKKNICVRMAEVISVKTDVKTIETSIGNFDYDIAVLAIGCSTNFFGNIELQRNAFTLKSTYDAIEIRNHILEVFERIASTSPEQQESLLNLVIAGAGPTGVELAGAFAEIRNNVLPGDFPGIDFSRFKVILVEGSAFTLSSMSPGSRRASEKYLLGMGVILIKETFVTSYDGEKLKLSNGQEFRSVTVIWAAGVIANRIAGLPENCYANGNRIKVDRLNRVIGVAGVFAIGDICSMETPSYPRGHPQVANVAINQAKLLARNIKALESGKEAKAYEYRDLGTMATIGRNKAVAELGPLRLKGYLAWLVWMSLHLMLILSVKNKLIILINWAWNYITKDSSLRLILKANRKSEDRG